MSDVKRKIYVCEYWIQGRCHHGDACSFVHAHVNPQKKGICQKHLQGLCRFTSELCHYQHLDVPLNLYEALSEETRNYAELKNKIENARAEEKEKNASTTTFGEIKERKTSAPENTVPMNRFTFEASIESDEGERLAVKSRLWSAFFELHPRKPRQELPGVRTLLPGPDSKSIKDWSCEEVASFIKLLGTAQIWGAHSRLFFENEIDGATLSEYGTMRSLMQDFRSIHPSHARVISTAVRERLGQP